eukprot:SM000052S17777  [mRNA]  locus=s52:635860:642941:+ [translate_table: standard]
MEALLAVAAPPEGRTAAAERWSAAASVEHASWEAQEWDWDGDLLIASQPEELAAGPADPPPPPPLPPLQPDSRHTDELTALLGTGVAAAQGRAQPPSDDHLPLDAAVKARNPDCPNLKAGRVPCACTDEDEKLLKRQRMVMPLAPLSCQVAGCRADLRSGKEYNLRHRVCEEHARAATVLSGGEVVRYCQQCGRKMGLTNGTEEPGSKVLEQSEILATRDRHKASAASVSKKGNSSKAEQLQSAKSRARSTSRTSPSPRSADSAVKESTTLDLSTTTSLSAAENSRLNFCRLTLGPVDLAQQTTPTENHSQEAEGNLIQQDELRAKPESGEAALETTAHLLLSAASDQQPVAQLEQAPGVGVPGFLESHTDTAHVLSLMALLTASGTDHLQEDLAEELNEQPSLLTPHEIRNFQDSFQYTPVQCSGRISFKLFDWNPADFPRHLRNQVMDWLSSMPSDLEGFISPGCTLLTLFAAMPPTKWAELESNLERSFQVLMAGEGEEFWAKGRMLVQCSNLVTYVKNGAVLCRATQLRPKDGPRLLSVRPMCVVAGEPAEVTITGHDLSLPGTRVLCSSRGRYIDSQILKEVDTGLSCSGRSEIEHPLGSLLEKQMLHLPATYCKGFGHLIFIEVEHGVGTSFVPLLAIHCKLACAEIQSLQACGGESNSEATWHQLLLELGWTLRMAERLRHGETTTSGRELKEQMWVHLRRLQQLLDFAVGRCWPAVTRLLLEAALATQAYKSKQMSSRPATQAEGQTSEDDVLGLVGIDQRGFSLLHGAVASKHLPVVRVLVEYRRCLAAQTLASSCQANWWHLGHQGPGKVSPLHLAALVDDGGRVLAALAGDEVEVAQALWNTCKDAAGKTPQEYAVDAGHSAYGDILVCSPLHHSSLSSENEKQPQECSVSKYETVITLCSRSADGPAHEASIKAKKLDGTVMHSDALDKFYSTGGGLRCALQALRSCNLAVSLQRTSQRSLITMLLAALIGCLGLCVLLQHPHRMQATSLAIRSSLSRPTYRAQLSTIEPHFEAVYRQAEDSSVLWNHCQKSAAIMPLQGATIEESSTAYTQMLPLIHELLK